MVKLFYLNYNGYTNLLRVQEKIPKKRVNIGVSINSYTSLELLKICPGSSEIRGSLKSTTKSVSKK